MAVIYISILVIVQTGMYFKENRLTFKDFYVFRLTIFE